MREALDWDRRLRYKRGAPQHLRGIDLFYDFRWRDYFSSGAAHFRGGQNLADVVIRECPDGRRPAILLTDRDYKLGGHAIETHHVVVINLPDYVARAEEPGTANAYMVELLGGGVTHAKRFSELTEDEVEEVAAWLDENLDAVALRRWAGTNERRLQVLREIVAEMAADDPGPAAEVERAIDALEALEGIDEKLADTIVELADEDGRLELLWALTKDDAGRAAATETLSGRTSDRLEDARAAADEFERLLEHAGETKIHGFLEDNPWLLGLDYAMTRVRQPVVRGTVDFLLERFDGFHDLLELKSPSDSIFDISDKRAEIRSPSRFRLSRPLSQALAQVHAYRDVLSEESTHVKYFGLSNTRDPMITILIGRASELDEQQNRLLHELNCSLHNVEIVPFDVVAQRARAVLDNAERYLVQADEQTGDREH